MSRPLLFLAQSLVLLTVASIHIAALKWYLYWYYPWLDILTHFLGGLWVALIAAWCIAYIDRRVSVLRVLGVVMTIGIGWEVFEVVCRIISPYEPNYVLDTALDLCMDFTGGLFGALCSRYLLRPKKPNLPRQPRKYWTGALFPVIS